jgi:hypothetical protein
MSEVSICNGRSCWIDTFDVAVTDADPNVLFTLTDGCNMLTTTRQLRMVLGKAIQNWIDANRAALDAAGETALLGQCDSIGCECGTGFTTVEWNFGDKTATLLFDSQPAGVSLGVTVVADQAFARVN